jgi:protease-4
MYGRFLGIVAESRHKTAAQVDQIAQGRVWDGGTAHQLGLVDAFGGMPEAIGKAAALAKLGDERGVTYLEPPVSWKEQLLETLASRDSDDDDATSEDAFAALARRPQVQLAAMLAEVRSILTGPSIQARCLECGGIAPQPVKREDVGLLAQIAAWLN